MSSGGGAPEVVTGGEAMGLLLASDDVALASARRFGAEIAGAESNVAIGLARLGHRVAFYGRVGNDVFGERIRRELRGEGVDVSALGTDGERPTGLLFRDTVLGSPLTVVYRRTASAATALAPEDLPAAAIRQARALHVTGITAALSQTAYDATLAAMTLAHESGVQVTFDPNLRLQLASVDRWREIVEALSRRSDVVLTGVDEAEIVCPGQDPVAWFGQRGVATVVLKRGAEGASEHEVATARSWHAGARGVPVVDPVGAGDAFDAGWLSAWLRDRSPEQRLTEACAVASLVVATRGDSTGLPDSRRRDMVLAEGPDVQR